MSMSPSTKEYPRGTCSKTRINLECWDRNNHERMLHTLEVDIFLEVGVDDSSVKNIWENWSVVSQKFFFNLRSFWTHICLFIWTKKRLKLLRCMHFNTFLLEHRWFSSRNHSNRSYPVQNCLVFPWGWGMLMASVFLTPWFRSSLRGHQIRVASDR